MKILFCVEFYYPSIGGAQEVVRQLAERMQLRGHQVTVASSKLANRSSNVQNGVLIKEFEISGNLVRGFTGNLEQYQCYLERGDFDVVFFYAAQQWTFDAAWTVLEKIKAMKVLVPCGYSGLFLPEYKVYFERLPEVLKCMDLVVYHAQEYRDSNYARNLGLRNGVLIPNAASLEEFAVERDTTFRNRIGASKEDFVILTVGSMTGSKGHLELAKAVDKIEFNVQNEKLFLILNGNIPGVNRSGSIVIKYIIHLFKSYGIKYSLKHMLKRALVRLGFLQNRGDSIADIVRKVNGSSSGKKKAVVCDLPRSELIQAYLNSNLFVFASNIEYSPLVLFEACASNLPFLTVPVGNSREIVAWTKGGEVCPATVDSAGYTRVDPGVLAKSIEELMKSPDRLSELGANGVKASRDRFNWDSIVLEYEGAILKMLEQMESPSGVHSEVANG
jgi:glycosyltransferase involved in cell wall biosynthesis